MIEVTFVCECKKLVCKPIEDRQTTTITCQNCKKCYDVFVRVYGYKNKDCSGVCGSIKCKCKREEVK